ncbi:class I SAM-dependent methyltransferase family protein [Plantactinospora sp. WMMC1484]|uniref:class I SAM-dependent methyltransferase family protein n=1 Tax=Plantactinospora sp. WMMC1484 TaxID=3404122 RepID=UPI003BF5D803
MAARDWHDWHRAYAQPASFLSRRLAVVQDRIREFLDRAAPGPLRVVSLCAGQGRDLLETLGTHPRRTDVTARLVELDPRNAAVAADTARTAGLDGVEVVVGDAALVDRYADLVPADLVLVCGVFGNITDDDVRRTVGYCAQLCATGGTVVWTRHRDEPDLVPRICDWFAAEGFTLSWISDKAAGFGVGVHRFAGAPRPLDRGARMFTFVADPPPRART